MGRKRKKPPSGKPKKKHLAKRDLEAPREDVKPSWRVRLAAIVVAIAVGPLFVALLETGLGLAGYGYPTDFFLKIPGREAYTTNARYTWQFFPPTIARTPDVISLPAQKASNTYRIFVLGESAAMGVPDSAFGFGQILRAILQQRYPGVRFEVVNAAMTAINSHVMLPLAAECARVQPDMFIVYAGNNEVVGPYGPGTIFAGTANLPLIRTGIWLGSTRIAQLAQNAAALVSEPAEAPGQWRGIEMFVDNLVPADDPEMERVYEHFRANLTDTCRVGLRAGAAVIVATVATNLKDNAPFASTHRRDLSEAEQARWQTIYDEALELFQAGEYEAAAEQLSEAATLDDRYADLHFLLARSLLALDKPREAREHIVLARDLDALRFRADSRLNQIIRDVTAEMAADGIRLVDIESAFEQSHQSQYGIPGDELLYEHVHLNFSGNYLLAKELLPSVEANLPDWIRESDGGDPPATEGEVAELLAYTDWDRYRLSAAMFQLMERPPFTGRSGHQEKMALLEQQLAEMTAKWTMPGALNPIREKYLSALERDPEDLELRARLANVLSRMGDHAGAAEQWRNLNGRVPDVSRWHLALAYVLADANRLNEALAEAQHSVELNPKLVMARLGLAYVLERIGRLEEATAEYETALRMDPDYAEGHDRLGVILRQRGQPVEALARFSEAVRLKPDFAEAHHNWGAALEDLGRTPDAITHYSEAVRLRPDFAQAHVSLGVALAGTGRLREAIVHFSEAVRVRPDFAQAHNNWGVILERLGEFQEAIRHYAEAVRLRPGFAEAHNNWGVALEKLGEHGQAVPHYREALRLNPGFADARRNLDAALPRLGLAE